VKRGADHPSPFQDAAELVAFLEQAMASGRMEVDR